MSAISFSGLHIGNYPQLPPQNFESLYEGVRKHVSPGQIAVAKLEMPDDQLLIVSTGPGPQPADIPIAALMQTYARVSDEGAKYKYDSDNAGLPGSELPKALTGDLLKAVYGVLPSEEVAARKATSVAVAEIPDKNAPLTSSKFRDQFKR
jgi:hypothetical protein